MSFTPLTVDYREKQSSSGKIPTTYAKKELGNSENEILTARLIDRSVRPLFPKGYGYNTQVFSSVYSYDGLNDPRVLAINASSAALAVSSIDWAGPVAATRIIQFKGSDKLEVNPLIEFEQSTSSNVALDMVFAGTEKGALMIEAEGTSVSNATFARPWRQRLKRSSPLSRVSERLQKNTVRKRHKSISQCLQRSLSLPRWRLDTKVPLKLLRRRATQKPQGASRSMSTLSGSARSWQKVSRACSWKHEQRFQRRHWWAPICICRHRHEKGHTRSRATRRACARRWTRAGRAAPAICGKKCPSRRARVIHICTGRYSKSSARQPSAASTLTRRSFDQTSMNNHSREILCFTMSFHPTPSTIRGDSLSSTGG